MTVLRPFLAKIVEEGWDVDTPPSALPRVTTDNTFNDTGDPVTVVVTTEMVGIPGRVSTKATTNQYDVDASRTAGDSWILGRLLRTVQQNSVEDRTATVPPMVPSPGTLAYACAIQGVTPVASLRRSDLHAPRPSAPMS